MLDDIVSTVWLCLTSTSYNIYYIFLCIVATACIQIALLTVKPSKYERKNVVQYRRAQTCCDHHSLNLQKSHLVIEKIDSF